MVVNLIGKIKEIYVMLLDNLESFEYHQLEVIVRLMEKYIDCESIINKLISEHRSSIIIKALDLNVYDSILCDLSYSDEQAEELLNGLVAGVDIKWYSNNLYSVRQMRAIQGGLMDSVDVSVYARLDYEPERMNAIRKRMVRGEELFDKNYIFAKMLDGKTSVKVNEDYRKGIIIQRIRFLSKRNNKYTNNALDSLKVRVESNQSIVLSPQLLSVSMRKINLSNMFPELKFHKYLYVNAIDIELMSEVKFKLGSTCSVGDKGLISIVESYENCEVMFITKGSSIVGLLIMNEKDYKDIEKLADVTMGSVRFVKTDVIIGKRSARIYTCCSVV